MVSIITMVHRVSQTYQNTQVSMYPSSMMSTRYFGAQEDGNPPQASGDPPPTGPIDMPDAQIPPNQESLYQGPGSDMQQQEGDPDKSNASVSRKKPSMVALGVSGVLFVVALGSIIWLSADKNAELQPKHMYIVRRVLAHGMGRLFPAGIEKSSYFKTSDTLAEKKDKVAAWKYAKTFWSEIQIVKYESMCYGNRNDANFVSQQHDGNVCEALGDGDGTQADDVCKTTPWYHLGHLGTPANGETAEFIHGSGAPIKSIMLELWERQQEFYNSHHNAYDLGMCNCIDQMFNASINHETNDLSLQRAREQTKVDINAFFNTHYSVNVTGSNVPDEKVLHYMRDKLMPQIKSVISPGSTPQSFADFHLPLLNQAATASAVTNPVPAPSISEIKEAMLAFVDYVRPSNLYKKSFKYVEDSTLVDAGELLFNSQRVVNTADFCRSFSSPTFTQEYAGTLDPSVYLMYGQLFLCCACLWYLQDVIDEESLLSPGSETSNPTEIERLYPGQTQASQAKGDQTESGLWASFNFGRLFLVLRLAVIVVFLFYVGRTPKSDFCEDGQKASLQMAGLRQCKTTDKKTTTDDTSITSHVLDTPNYLIPLNWLFGILSVIQIVVELYYAYKVMNWESDRKKEDTSKGLKSRGQTNTHRRLIGLVSNDVYIMLGLTLMAMSVLLQNGLGEMIVLQSVVFFVLSVSFLQHMSNVVNIAFDWTAAWQISQNPSQSQSQTNYFMREHTHPLWMLNPLDMSAQENNAETNLTHKEQRHAVMLRMCWFRGGIIVVAVICGFFVAFHHNPNLDMHQWIDLGVMQLTLYSIALVVILCGFDFIYEAFNVRQGKSYVSSFDKTWMNISFVSVYIAFSTFLTKMMV